MIDWKRPGRPASRAFAFGPHQTRKAYDHGL